MMPISAVLERERVALSDAQGIHIHLQETEGQVENTKKYSGLSTLHYDTCTRFN